MHLKKLISHEVLSGILLLLALVCAIIVSNSSIYTAYLKLIHLPLILKVGSFQTDATLLEFVNDGLMALFFLLIGLELKYHLTAGAYQSKDKLILPITAAVGGFVIPALIYIHFNRGQDTLDGWAIPVATDTAFVLGILSFFQHKISLGLRIFVLGFSLVDDIIAIGVLAAFYTASINLTAFGIALLLIGGLWILNQLRVNPLAPYLITGLLLWIAIVESGIHGTLAGVILAIFIPVQAKYRHLSSLQRLEKGLDPIVSYGILPLFAFINSEIPLHKMNWNDLYSNVSFGIILGLFIGKQLGISVFSYIMVRLKYCVLPENTSWLKYYAISVFGGVGFTLSLFIGSIAFYNEYYANTMRIAIIFASFLSAFFGIILLKRAK